MTDSTVELPASRPDPAAGRPAVTKSDETPGQIKKFRVGIGAQLYLILFGSVLLTLTASLVAYFSFRETLSHESRLAEYSMPNLINAVDVARQSAIVVGGAFRLISADSEQEHDAVVVTVAQERASLESIIEELESRSAFGERTRLIKEHLAELNGHLEQIRHSSARRLEIDQTLTGLGEELAELNRSINRLMVESLDNQGFYLVEGLRSLDDIPHRIEQRASEEELTIYRNLANLSQQANLAVLLLDEVILLSDRQFLPPLQDRFHSASENTRNIFEKLSGFRTSDLQGSSLLQQLGQLFRAEEKRHFSLNLLSANLRRLGEIGEGSEGIIPLCREVLQRLEMEQNELGKVRIASGLLVTEVNNLVSEINQEAHSASAASRSSVRTGILWLIIINLFSTAAALLFAWRFVGRYLLRRLIGLAKAMRRMAEGDLKVPVEVGGNDEVTDMAEALEVFRQYAQEVQRLNLVEKLAQELDARNESLEQALEELKKAQEQIIAEQKLASLGQLTAGVAHEIKNPLNFIGNFSAVAGELTDEIEELIKEKRVENPDAFKDSGSWEEIQSIFGELRLSLGRIVDHSKRADGIVHSMLEHSRSSEGEWREVDLNAILKQYVELAYHALRAEEIGFNMAREEDLDPDMGLLEVIPQEISRVFMNLATNACQALNEKRLTAEKDWEPELRIVSRRFHDHAKFCIRDNGSGIPEELRKRIFEPFVTTKDPGKGTGLGLSLTSDVIIRHGGSIELDTEEGSFTEMCILLPLEPPVQSENEKNAESGNEDD